MGTTITEADIREIAANPAKEIVAGIVGHQKFIAEGGIDTPLRLSHFMAQLAHESAHFRTTREFASGEKYEGRKDLGNTVKGDGKRYRGRGLIQTTGRANYREATQDIQKLDPATPDFEANPEVLEQFPWALLAGVSYWRRRGINKHADRDDLEAVTRAINGGLNGLDDRRNYLRKTKGVWMGERRASDTNPVLRQDDSGNAVWDLQSSLVERGFKVLVDGDFGKHTTDAVKEFQRLHGMKADGVVGSITWAALRSRPA